MKTALRLLALVALVGLASAADLPMPAADRAASTVWHGNREDLHRQLKEWRAPYDIIEAVLYAHANWQARPARLTLYYPNGVKRWQGPSLTREGREKLSADNKATQAAIRALLGPAPATPEPAADTVWRAAKGDLFRQLRQWQAPDDMILAVLFAHAQHLNAAELQAIRDNVKDRSRLPRIGEIHARSRAEIRAIMGPDFDVALVDEQPDPALRIKWGAMTREQLAKIKWIKEREDTTVALGGGYSDFLSAEALSIASTIDEKFATDVRAVLGTEATEEFLVFNSRAAIALQRRLARAGLEVDEATYRILYRRGREFRAELAKRPVRHLFDWGLEEIRQFEEILGHERAVALAAGSMGNFATMDKSLVADGADARTRLDIYYLYVETTIRASLTRSNPPADPAGEEKRIMADGERLHRLLEAGMSAAHFAAFNNSGDGRMVEAWRKTGRMPLRTR